MTTRTRSPFAVKTFSESAVMIEERIWGSVPAEFVKLRPDRNRWALVRHEIERYLDGAWFFADIGSLQSARRLTGRGQLRAYRLPNGEGVLVRQYRHGGVLRRLTGELFFTWPPRPFQELRLTEEARRRGVRTLDLLGAWVDRVWGPFYRGWLMSRELEGACDLWAAVQSGLYTGESKRALLEAVAATLREMHGRGVYHSDLNLKNILVRPEGGQIRSYVIDFDKAQIFPHAVPPSRAAGNLRRLLRSVSKLDPDGRWVPQADWDLLVRCYQDAEG
jgi:tRNA A-37 threonylcarbamoyl transferase component Bud32